MTSVNLHSSPVCFPGVLIGSCALTFHSKRAKLATFWHTGSPYHLMEASPACPRFLVVKRPSSLST
jgi:hypothetical protein